MKKFSGAFHFPVLVFVALLMGACAGPKRLCEHVVLQDRRISFNRSEKKLICGDRDDPNWNDIPRPQVIYHLKTFLLERGYFAPQFLDDPDELRVIAGPRTTVKAVEVHGWIDEVPAFRERRFVGRALNPATLNALEADIMQAFREEGFACAQVKLQAVAEQGLVVATVSPGSRHRFGEIWREPTHGVRPGTLARFEGFSPEDIYNYKEVELAERRLRASGILQDVTYLPRCENGDFHIEQKSFLGKARFISIGAGFDTEQYVIGKARFKVSRLSDRGSSLESQVFASFKIQSLTNMARFYVWDAASRLNLYSGADVEREDEKHYETIRATLRGGLESGHDTRHWAWTYRLGPHLERLWIFRGPGFKNTKALGLESNLTLVSHAYEYYQGDPQRGSRLSLDLKSSHREVGSTFSAVRLKLSADTIARVWDNHASDLLLAFRTSLATVLQPETRANSPRIPASYRLFLGGASDMRGFGRQELPKSGEGAFTSAYLGSELRWARIFPVEPLIFLDAGVLGYDSFEWRDPYYLSPGLGARYKSPFGTLRASLARGLATRAGPESERPEHFQFFLSFGQEF